jgi:hypothetical protein
MTEEPKVDKLDGGGADSKPKEDVSPKQSFSIEDVVTKEEFSELQSQLRGLQGRQDKADAQQDAYQEMIDRYEELRSDGKSSEEAKGILSKQDKDKEKDDLLMKIAQKVGVLEPSPSIGSGTVGSKAVDTNRLIEELELDPNDDKVNEILANGLDEAQTESALLRHKLGLYQSAPSISAAPSKGSGAATPSNSEELFTRLAQLAVNYTDNKSEIDKVEAELRSRGDLK